MDNPLVSTTLFTVCSAGGLEEGNGKDDPNVDMRTGGTRFSCDACGASNLAIDDYDSPVRLVDVWRSRPKKWPDILRSCSSRLWAVDEKVVADMEAFGLTGYRLQKLVVEESIPPRKRPPKPYWAVIPTGRAAYLTSAHPEKPHDFCPKCGRFLSKPDDDDRLCCRLVDGSWDGSDWVLATHNNLRPDVVCSERVVECARTCGWKNAYFGVPPGARKTLSGCGKALPPESPGGLADFSGILPPGAASIAIDDPGRSDAGSVELNYSLDPDPPRRTLTIRIGVDRKTKRLSVLSSEVD